jgi:hypothetical protein
VLIQLPPPPLLLLLPAASRSARTDPQFALSTAFDQRLFEARHRCKRVVLVDVRVKPMQS